ncbi:hypothetical protein [Alteromonas sp. ASW11-130]|uniref:hypothetical protein n=1 Tax=Alteromonas sp. ASW11-130 TaxID=3015775 RepID=UPI002241ED7C|nr:hypothetical protein [Alteromonas sp. ASW11-130]MCW8090909.1 hypothetical protein [Alteromonas sp. ASW11-130]
MFWVHLKKFSASVLALLLLAFLAGLCVLLSVEYGEKKPDFIGCYASDAMLMSYSCQGFQGSEIASYILNWPLWLVYAPLFSLFSLKALGATLLLWSPVGIFILSVIRLKRENGLFLK